MIIILKSVAPFHSFFALQVPYRMNTYPGCKSLPSEGQVHVLSLGELNDNSWFHEMSPGSDEQWYDHTALPHRLDIPRGRFPGSQRWMEAAKSTQSNEMSRYGFEDSEAPKELQRKRKVLLCYLYIKDSTSGNN